MSDTLLSLKQLKAIKNKYQFTVFGYIREKQEELSLDTIPPIISYTCLAFYFHKTDEFDPKKCGENLTLLQNKETIRWEPEREAYGNNASTAFCTLWIDTKIKQIVKWKLKIHENSDTRSVMIRLVSNDKHKFGVPSYGFCNQGNTFTNGSCTARYGGYNNQFANKFNAGEISVIFNTETLSVSIINNEGETKLIYKGIQGAEYRYKLAVVIYTKGQSVTLMDFDTDLID